MSGIHTHVVEDYKSYSKASCREALFERQIGVAAPICKVTLNVKAEGERI
jgi:hypothetical protein